MVIEKYLELLPVTHLVFLRLLGDIHLRSLSLLLALPNYEAFVNYYEPLRCVQSLTVKLEFSILFFFCTNCSRLDLVSRATVMSWVSVIRRFKCVIYIFFTLVGYRLFLFWQLKRYGPSKLRLLLWEVEVPIKKKKTHHFEDD